MSQKFYPCVWFISLFTENSLKCARKSNHTVVHFVLFHEFEIVSNHTYGWNTDDDGIPTTYVVDLYIIE